MSEKELHAILVPTKVVSSLQAVNEPVQVKQVSVPQPSNEQSNTLQVNNLIPQAPQSSPQVTDSQHQTYQAVNLAPQVQKVSSLSQVSNMPSLPNHNQVSNMPSLPNYNQVPDRGLEKGRNPDGKWKNFEIAKKETEMIFGIFSVCLKIVSDCLKNYPPPNIIIF